MIDLMDDFLGFFPFFFFFFFSRPFESGQRFGLDFRLDSLSLVSPFTRNTDETRSNGARKNNFGRTLTRVSRGKTRVIPEANFDRQE